MRRAGKWIAGILGGITLLVVLAVILFDWSRFAPWVANRLSAASGREVTLADLDVDMSWHPRVTLTGLRVANADWAREPLMADVERLQFVVSIPALLRGRLELPEITVEKPKIRLEQDREGRANWDFTSGELVAEAATPDDRFEMPLIGDFSINGGALVYRDLRKGIDFRSDVESVDAEAGGRKRLRLKGEGTLEQKPFRLELLGGSLLALREGDEPYPLRLDLVAGGTRFHLDGTMLDPIKLDGADLRLTLAGPDLAEIFPIFGIPTPTTAAYELAGRLRRGEGQWRVDGLQGRIGESDISGWVAIDPREEVPLIRAELLSKQLRLIDLGGLIGLDPGKADPTEGVAPPGKVLPDVPVSLERLRAADMDIQFTGDNVVVPDLPLQQVAFHLKLKGGRAVLEPLRFTADIGQIAGTVTLDGRQSVPEGAFDLGIRNLGLKPFVKGTAFEAETEGSMAGRLQLKGHGASLSDILASADGEAVLVMENGRVSHLLVEVAGLDAAEAIGSLLGGDEAIGVRCLVADFGVQKGVMQSKTLVLDTDDTNIAGRLKLDLGQETLDGRFRPKPKDFSPLTARVPITLGGTLADPAIGVDGGRLAGKGAAALALGALLTPLAAIVPFLDAGGGEDSPCRSLVRTAQAPG